MDIVSLINGLKTLLLLCLNNKDLGISQNTTKEEFSLKSFFGINDKKQQPDIQKDVHSRIYEALLHILKACTNCWDGEPVV